MNRRKPIRYDPSNDLYGVLGVSPAATAEDVRRSYRQRAKEVHPDVNPDNAAWAHQQFQRLNDAYDILNDAVLRAEYNAVRNRYVAPGETVPWWDKPHPTSRVRPTPTSGAGAAESADSKPKTDTSSVPPASNDGTIFTRASSAASRRYGKRGRKSRLRPYHYLFFFSMMTLIVSIFSSFAHAPVSSAQLSSTPTLSIPSLWMPLQLNTCSDPRAVIEDPIDGSFVPGHFSVRGTATGEHFLSYSIDMAPVTALIDDTNNANTVPNWSGSSGNHPVIDGLLVPDGSIHDILPGDYTLRLTVRLDDGTIIAPCEVEFHVIHALG